MSYLAHTKNFNTFMEVLLRDPQRYRPIVELRDIMTRQFKELTWAECELIGAEISRQNGSEFCTGIRKGIAEALDADSGILNQEKYRPIVEFALKLNEDASSIMENDVQSVRDAGWSDQTVEDVVGLVAMTNVFNILAKGLGFSGVSDSVFSTMGKATVAEQGYAPLFSSFLKKAGTPETRNDARAHV